MLSEPIFHKRNPLMLGKLPPERTINRNVLSFFLPPSHWSKEYPVEIRQIADILKIPVYEDIEQVTKIHHLTGRTGFFIPVWDVDELSFKTVHYLMQCGHQVVIGDIARANHQDKEYNIPSFYTTDVAIVPADWFLSTLLWDEFGLSYRAIRIYLNSPFVINVLIPYLRKLGLGEPQFRVYFEELGQQKALGIFTLKDKIIREFAVELDFEPTEMSMPKLVFCQEQQRAKNVLDRLTHTITTRYEVTERTYLCVKITPDYDLCCYFGITEDKKPIIEFGEVWRRGKYEFKPRYEMRKDQRDEQHTREGLHATLKMIGAYCGMIPLPEHQMQSWAIDIIRKRIEKQDENV